MRIRLVLDGSKFQVDPVTNRLCMEYHLPVRLAHGRLGLGSKMHHKFAILDNQILLTGSYNWTKESEEENHENLLVLHDPALVQKYQEEFEALWNDAEKIL